MANKKAILNQLADYFAKNGMMTPSEYKVAEDAPMRYMAAKRPFGSWARMQSMVQKNFPEQWAKANPVVAATPAPKAEEKVATKTAKAAPKKAEKK